MDHILNLDLSKALSTSMKTQQQESQPSNIKVAVSNNPDAANKECENIAHGTGVFGILEAARDSKERRRILQDINDKLAAKTDYRIPVNIEIDQDIIKQTVTILSSKVELASDRVRFLLKVIEYGDEYWIAKAFDLIPNLPGINSRDQAELKQIFSMCKMMIKEKSIPVEIVLDTASAFYLENQFQYCYTLFSYVLKSKRTTDLEKYEAAKFLYHINDNKYFKVLQTQLSKLIVPNNDELNYQMIKQLVTERLSSKYINVGLSVNEINQVLVSNLFLKFISLKPDQFYTIQACEFLLEQKAMGYPYFCENCCLDEMIEIVDKPCVCKKNTAKRYGFCDDCFDFDSDELLCCNTEPKYGFGCVKDKVNESLLEIAENKDLHERVRADAADVVLRHKFTESYFKRAQDVIYEIGTANMTEIETSVYTNKENVHMMTQVFEDFIVKHHEQLLGTITDFDDVVEEIEELLEEALSDDKFKVRRSLDRIDREMALHTTRKIKTRDILALIWDIINKHKQSKELQTRLVQELIDMSNTCTSGHVKRLVNVLVGYTDELEGTITIVDQLEANIKARFNSLLKQSDNVDDLLEDMVSDDKSLYKKFLSDNSESIRAELLDEFVDEGWVSQKKFDTIFIRVCDQLIV